jgi:hypothetical protein
MRLRAGPPTSVGDSQETTWAEVLPAPSVHVNRRCPNSGATPGAAVPHAPGGPLRPECRLSVKRDIRLARGRAIAPPAGTEVPLRIGGRLNDGPPGKRYVTAQSWPHIAASQMAARLSAVAITGDGQPWITGRLPQGTDACAGFLPTRSRPRSSVRDLARSLPYVAPLDGHVRGSLLRKAARSRRATRRSNVAIAMR